MNKKLAELKQKIKKHAPIIVSTTAVIAATTLAIRNQMLKKELERVTLGYEDNEEIKDAWRVMKETGDDQLFRDSSGNPLFKMTEF